MHIYVLYVYVCIVCTCVITRNTHTDHSCRQRCSGLSYTCHLCLLFVTFSSCIHDNANTLLLPGYKQTAGCLLSTYTQPHRSTHTQPNIAKHNHKYFSIDMYTYSIYIYKGCLYSRAPSSQVHCSTLAVDNLDISPTASSLVILLPHLLPDITTAGIYYSSWRFRDRIHVEGI